jgi:hypothetical protein
VRSSAILAFAAAACVLAASGCGRELPTGEVAKFSGNIAREYTIGSVVGDELIDSLQGVWMSNTTSGASLTIIDDRIRYGAWRHGIWAMNHDWTYRVTDSRIALRDSATGALRGHLAVTLSDEWKDLALPLKFECISADCGSAGALLFVRWGKIDESGNWLGG